jgi:hypothetical protein
MYYSEVLNSQKVWHHRFHVNGFPTYGRTRISQNFLLVSISRTSCLRYVEGGTSSLRFLKVPSLQRTALSMTKSHLNRLVWAKALLCPLKCPPLPPPHTHKTIYV